MSADTTPGKKNVKLHNSLGIEIKEINISDDIIQDIRRQIPQNSLEGYKYNTQLLLDLCNYVENNVKKKTSKNLLKNYSKKDIVLKVCSELWNDIDLEKVDGDINVLYENGMIKKKDCVLVKLLTYVYRGLTIVLRR